MGLFFQEQIFLCSVGVADWEACEQPRRLLLAEGTVVILILPLVTRHPAVGTPGFLEQLAPLGWSANWPL